MYPARLITSTNNLSLTVTSSRKVRCITKGTGKCCERCASRQIRCSYVQHVASERPPNAAARRETELVQHAPLLGTSDSPAVYRLNHDTPVLDISRGRPEDILREGELMQSLLLLYFSNFNDVHFLFDEELFLREYTVGEVPKVILYCIMALSIRYSPNPNYSRLTGYSLTQAKVLKRSVL
jgi:hypothetical protein